MGTLKCQHRYSEKALLQQLAAKVAEWLNQFSFRLHRWYVSNNACKHLHAFLTTNSYGEGNHKITFMQGDQLKVRHVHLPTEKVTTLLVQQRTIFQESVYSCGENTIQKIKLTTILWANFLSSSKAFLERYANIAFQLREGISQLWQLTVKELTTAVLLEYLERACALALVHPERCLSWDPSLVLPWPI